MLLLLVQFSFQKSGKHFSERLGLGGSCARREGADGYGKSTGRKGEVKTLMWSVLSWLGLLIIMDRYGLALPVMNKVELGDRPILLSNERVGLCAGHPETHLSSLSDPTPPPS